MQERASKEHKVVFSPPAGLFLPAQAAGSTSDMRVSAFLDDDLWPKGV